MSSSSVPINSSSEAELQSTPAEVRENVYLKMSQERQESWKERGWRWPGKDRGQGGGLLQIRM